MACDIEKSEKLYIQIQIGIKWNGQEVKRRRQ